MRRWHSAAIHYIEYKLSIVMKSCFSGTALDVVLSNLAAWLEWKILTVAARQLLFSVIVCLPIYLCMFVCRFLPLQTHAVGT